MRNLVFGFLALTVFSILPVKQHEAGAADLPLVNGIVRRVDLPNNKVTIRHDYIPNLDMAAMTMSFTAADPRLIQDLSPGDRIRFTADNVNGVLMILSLERL